MNSFFSLGALLGISAAFSPGPFQSLVISESLVGGWRRAAPITFAPLIADIPIAGVLVFVLYQVPESFLNAIRFAGALLLFYLAWRLWKQMEAGINADQSETSSNARRGFLWGVLMLFLSPGPYLFWSLINGPILLNALDLSIWHALAFVGSFYFFSIGGLLLIAYLLSKLGRLNERAHQGLQFASLGLMLLIALLLIQQGIAASA